jgi:predicted transposase YdaD
LIRINTKDNHQEKLNEIKEMIAVAKLEKMTSLEQQVRKFFSKIILL